jgi:hypothetical protein
MVERLHRTLLDDPLRIQGRTVGHETVEEMQKALDVYRLRYTRERPHRGYRNMSRRPIDTINQASATVRHDGE